MNMKNYFNFFVLLIIYINIRIIKAFTEKIDLSDKNPIVLCLKTVKKFSFEQVKDYLLKIQDPEYALENDIHDPLFALCVEQNAKDNV